MPTAQLLPCGGLPGGARGPPCPAASHLPVGPTSRKGGGLSEDSRASCMAAYAFAVLHTPTHAPAARDGIQITLYTWPQGDHSSTDQHMFQQPKTALSS